MFSLKQGDELVFQIQTNNPNPDQQSIQQDLLLSQGSPQGGNKRHRQKPSSIGQDTSKDDERSKKIMHREIERQRRQEMGQLHGSLRSLLPLEFIKVMNFLLFFFLLISFWSLNYIFSRARFLKFNKILPCVFRESVRYQIICSSL